MAFEDYVKAQKLGAKAHRAAIAEGKNPYLPVLDEILTQTEIERETQLGTSEIPLNQVVGTATAGRTQAFAPNFMPLLEAGTEFAYKWSSLCDAQMEEGIRDAVKVYEYMNRYYVLEGNKRVSVLKYVNNPTILADVTRKVPRRSDEPANQIYYEYMDFYALTHIDYVLFSKKGRYAKLLTEVGKNQEDVWTEEERRRFSFFYANFERAFIDIKGQRIARVTCGDAMLLYLALYPYEQSWDDTEAEVKEKLAKMKTEIELFGDEDSVEVSMDPTEKKATVTETVINRIIPQKRKRIAFVYSEELKASSWLYGHEQGRLHLKQVFGDTIETRVYMTDTAGKYTEQVLRNVCEEGCDIIFTVNPRMMKACLKTAVEYPDVIILNCALNSPHHSVRAYYARMYEASFLTGMIAGAMCTNDKIGFVADYPLFGVAAGINAFALGAKMVNPYAKVYLTWSTAKDYDMEKYFWEQEISCIFEQDVVAPRDEIGHFGLYHYINSEKRMLAAPEYRWGVFYEKIVKGILKGSWKAEESAEKKAINYWWGMSAGVIDVICSDELPAGTRKLIDLTRQHIVSGAFHPFTGPLIQQGGRVHYDASETMKPEDIMRMDWLVDNVVGHIPTVDELREEIQPVVMLKGLYAVTVDKGGNALL
ncbi:MAG: BMP family ABC transporter substrate-binding protein [Lachnospiraceae bacterium]|nr:BMP family ABC transporter substrate-binding protein [Lachnospiraceae bacterium]